MAVPLFAAAGALAAVDSEVRAKVAAVLDKGVFVLGEEVRGFEAEFAAYVGVPHAVGVANGTDAIVLALRALGVGPGDDVVVPSFTFYASAEAIALTGARPVFCDIDPRTFCVTEESVRAALTPATKAVLAVHLFGNVAPVAAIEALGVPVVEDAAQAAGSRTGHGRPGALGAVATFSFYPSKNLPACGDGGAVTTRDEALAERVRMLRFHGSRDKRTFELVGHNSRLDELQAGILRVLLPHLDAWSDGRRAAARAYAEAGLGELVALPEPTRGSEPAWHLYVVRHERADELVEALDAAGIGARGYYREPVHRQPAMRSYGLAGPALPGTEEAAATNLAIPMGPALRPEQAGEVVAALRAPRAAEPAGRRVKAG